MHWSSTLRLLHWARCNSLKVHLRSSVNVKFADALKRRIEDNIEVWPILLLHPVQHVTSNQRMTTQNHQIQKNMFWIHSVLFSNFHDIIKSWQMWMDDEFFSQGAVLKSLGISHALQSFQGQVQGRRIPQLVKTSCRGHNFPSHTMAAASKKAPVTCEGNLWLARSCDTVNLPFQDIVSA